jgi:hypothetical protein
MSVSRPDRATVPTNVPTNVPTSYPQPRRGAVVDADVHGQGRDMTDDRTYDVYALEPADHSGHSRYVGTFADFDTALAARDDDLVAQLAATGGWYGQFDHVIVGPGLHGPRTVLTLAAAIGVDPGGCIVPGPDDLTEAREWLRRVASLGVV